MVTAFTNTSQSLAKKMRKNKPHTKLYSILKLEVLMNLNPIPKGIDTIYNDKWLLQNTEIFSPCPY